MRKFNWPRAIGSVIALLFCALLSVPASRGASAIPRFGFSISSDADALQFAKTAAGYKIKNVFVMLPPELLNLGSEERQNGTNPVLEGIFASMPAESHLYVRLKVEFGSFTQKGKELENLLSGRIESAVSRLPLNNPAVEGLMVEIGTSSASAELVQFALADIAVKSKARRGNLTTVLSFPGDFIEKSGALLRRLANYYDALSPVFTQRWPETLSWISKQALNKRVFMKMEPPAEESEKRIASAYLDVALAVAESSVDVLYVEPPNLEAFSRLCSVASFLSRYLSDDFVVTASPPQPFAIAFEGGARGNYKTFTNAQSQDIGLVVRLETAEKPTTILLRGPSGTKFETEWYDAITGSRLKPGEPVAESTGIAQAGIPGSTYTFILIRNLAGSGSRLHSSVEVVARADLTVEEVVARWQQYRESQKQLLQNYISDCFMNLHFEVSLLSVSGFDISMQLAQFWNRGGFVEWAQSDFYVNGVKFGKGKEFPLPQLEPEKVVSQPLELNLDEKYRYKLDGTDQVDGKLCYVVGVEPKESNTTLYSGRVWIDGTTFRHVKMELNQRGTKGSIISNVETQNFSLVPDGKGNEFNLTRSIYAQQTLNAAGRNFIIQKTYDFTNYRINAADFEPALTAAHLSDSTMYRDTDTGLNILKKEGDKRVPVETGKRVRSIIGGVLYEGSFDFPIPLAGLSVVDFDYRGTGAQLSVFFAGPILAANLSKQWKSRYRLGWDVALSGLPGNNRIYEGSTELKNQSFYEFEEATGVRGTWQATTSLSLTGAFHVSYDFYRATGDTDQSFTLPRNGFMLTPSFELKYARTGYLFTAGASSTHRINWRDFGLEGGVREPVRNQFDKYYADFSKDFYLAKFTKTGFNLAYYSGDKQDRISRYRTSFLGAPRIKGIPSGTDSFDTVGVASANYGINMFEFIKLEGSYNHAWARNWGESRHFRNYDGLQFDFGTAGPWSTYLQGSITYAIAGNLDRYNSRWGIYFLIYKPIR